MEHLTPQPDITHQDSGRGSGERHISKRLAAITASLLFLVGCTPSNDVDAKGPPSSHETTVTVEAPPMTLDEARDALESFSPRTTPELYDFNAGDNKENAQHDAEAYLKLKDSRLAIINFTDIPADEAKEFGKVVEDRIELVTQKTFSVRVDVFEASDTAKQLYKERKVASAFNQDNVKDYASVVADIAMPEVDAKYQSVIALTNSGFSGRSFAYFDGKYADIANVAKEYNALVASGENSDGDDGLLNDPRNSTVHEWLHAIAGLEHSKSATNDNGDIGGSFRIGSGGISSVNLMEFLQQAHIDEYGGGGIMGATHDIGGMLQPLSAAEIYETETAERFLEKPYTVSETSLDDTSNVTYTPNDTPTVAVLSLPTELGANSLPTEHELKKLVFTPLYQEPVFEGENGYWRVGLSVIESDNSLLNLGSVDLTDDPSSQHRVIELSDGSGLSLQLTHGSLTLSTH